ncbi:MAG: hypothetical protein H7A23_12760 [Leptospiraceae bacterium]|nr:hypothetical protein [Leptospiraceae bacterium]MCP5495421.1 hypothetical protein [Leptospiraceae bacterium]
MGARVYQINLKGNLLIPKKFGRNENLFYDSFILAKVLDGQQKKSNYYTLFSKGKKFEVYSDLKLIKGENLNLKVNHKANHVDLKVVDRFYYIGNERRITKDFNIWLKSNLFPMDIIKKGIEQFSRKSVEISKIVSLLAIYLPGIEWDVNTPYFHWDFSEGKADAYIGKLEKLKIFYLKIITKKVGVTIFYLKWEQEDLSDLIVYSFFENLEAYNCVIQKKDVFSKYLSDYGINPFEIVIRYSSETGLKNYVEWEA